MPVGAVSAVLFVLLEGHTHVVTTVTPPSRWFGLLDVWSPGARGLASLVAWVAILVLGWCWLSMASTALAGRLRVRTAAVTGVLWAAPFAVGPTLTSLDMYIYAAHGWLSSSGRSPYIYPPGALGPGPVLNSVDPLWHRVLSPYGPVGTLLEHGAVLVGRTPLGTVLMLRLLASLAVVAAIAFATMLSRPAHRARTLVLFGLNPLLLTTTFAAAHFEATMIAALLGGLYASRRGRPALALVLVVVAGLIKLPAFAALPFLVLEDWRGAEHRTPVVLRDLTAVAASLGVSGFLVPHGWAWTHTVLHTPATGREWWMPTTLLAEICGGVGRVLGFDVTTESFLGVTRTTGLVVSVVLFLYLLRHRGDVLLRLGVGLTGLALLGFVLYPWYLLWGWPLLVIAGRRRLAFVSSAVACAFTMANLWPQRREASALADSMSAHPVAALIGTALSLAAGAGLLWMGLRRGGRTTSEQAAGADVVAPGVGRVEQNPAVLVREPGALVADGRAQHQSGTPADS
jgi:alpha-1,6-mannosyltransferase